MSIFQDRAKVGRLILAVLTNQKKVRDALLLFPETDDKNIKCAYHALVHYEADENLRYMDIEYKEEQDDYLEFLANNLIQGKELPKNILGDYEDFYKDVAHKWQKGFKGFLKEFLRFINV